METGQWTYTLTPENEYWNTMEFFDTREEAVKEGIKAAKKDGDVKKIAISEIEVHQIGIIVDVESMIERIEEDSIVSAGCTNWLEYGDFLEEFSIEEIDEIKNIIVEKMWNKRKNKEYWTTLTIEEIDV